MKLIRQCDSLRAILEQAVVVNPWSVLWNLGVKVSITIDISSVEPHTALGAGHVCFPMTIMINEESALDCSLVIAPSVSPLNVGAGVISVVGVRPGERHGTVMMQVLAARRGS